MKLQTEIVREGQRYLVSTFSAGGYGNKYETIIFEMKDGVPVYNIDLYFEPYSNEEDAELGHEETCSSWRV